MRSLTTNKDMKLRKIKSNKKNINIMIINLILIIGWMMFIFYMSDQPASISSSQSGDFKEMIINTPIIGDIAKPTLTSQIGEFVIRKSAHMFLYFVLSILIFNIVYKIKYNNNKSSILKSALISLLIVFLYACTDEIHQLFIPGRSGEFRDVMVDTFGGLIGLILMGIIRINHKAMGKLKTKN